MSEWIKRPAHSRPDSYGRIEVRFVDPNGNFSYKVGQCHEFSWGPHTKPQDIFDSYRWLKPKDKGTIDKEQFFLLTWSHTNGTKDYCRFYTQDSVDKFIHSQLIPAMTVDNDSIQLYTKYGVYKSTTQITWSKENE